MFATSRFAIVGAAPRGTVDCTATPADAPSSPSLQTVLLYTRTMPSFARGAQVSQWQPAVGHVTQLGSCGQSPSVVHVPSLFTPSLQAFAFWQTSTPA